MLIVLSYCAPGIILHEMFCYNCWKIIGTWDSWECWASIGSELQSLSRIALMNYWAFNFLRYIVECGLSCRVYSCWIFFFNPVPVGGGGHAPPSKISIWSSGIAFWVTLVGWRFLSTHTLGGSIYFWVKNYLEKVLEYHFWGKGHHLKAMKGIFLKLQSYVKSQLRGFWGWPT